jgi:hypothetical protein
MKAHAIRMEPSLSAMIAPSIRKFRVTGID